ncbi:MAG TPA: hypothetical protein VGQ65_14755 [Thermoanaerobaculia bacterium]|jgi:hypothetical protein|nr:hypothetical protein [Thermoanaerobaculia bacterium]
MSGPNDPTYYEDILPLFTELDIDCMRGRSVFLASYAYMSDAGNAEEVFGKLSPDAGNGRMPLGGPYWSQDSLDLYSLWMSNGRKEGTPPDNLPPDPNA